MATKQKQQKQGDVTLDRPVPFDLNAEIGVLGSVILMPSVFDEIAEILRASDFYDDAHRGIFLTMQDIRMAGNPIDDTILVASLKASGDYEAVGGASYLAKVVNAVPNAAHATYYAEIVAKHSYRRHVIEEATAILRDAYDQDDPLEIMDRAEVAFRKIADRSFSKDEPILLGQAAREVARKLSNPDRMAQVNRCDWGHVTMDERIGPIMAGEMAIVAARPGNSKTSLGMQVLRHSAEQGRPSLMISLEMGRDQLATREVARLADLDTRKIRRGDLSNEDVQAILKAQESIGDLPLWMWSPPMATFSAIRSTIRKAVSKHGIKVAAIDYLGLVERERTASDSTPRHEFIGAVSRGLKRLSKEVGIPLVVLQQLSRDADDTEPSLRHLKDSGSIEQDADLVLFLHHGRTGRKNKADIPPEERQVIMAKFRDGPSGDFKVEWDGRTFTFNTMGTRAEREAQASATDQQNLVF